MKVTELRLQVCEEHDGMGDSESLTSTLFRDGCELAEQHVGCGEGNFPT